MENREKIIEFLSSERKNKIDYYSIFKNSFLLYKETTEISNIDDWFKSVIESLYYNVNKKLLVIKYPFEFNLECIDFISSKEETSIYRRLIKHETFTKNSIKTLNDECFLIYKENLNECLEPSCNKRLCSYTTTVVNWPYPQRKNIIVLDCSYIDKDTINSINIEEMWKQIFSIFCK